MEPTMLDDSLPNKYDEYLNLGENLHEGKMITNQTPYNHQNENISFNSLIECSKCKATQPCSDPNCEYPNIFHS